METVLILIGGMASLALAALLPLWMSGVQGGTQPSRGVLFIVQIAYLTAIPAHLIYVLGVVLLIRRRVRLLRGETGKWVPPKDEGRNNTLIPSEDAP